MELGYENDIEDVYTWALDHKVIVDNKLNDLLGNDIDNVIEDTIAEMPNALKMLEDS